MSSNSNDYGEQIVFSMRTHPKALVAPVFAGLVAIAAAIAISLFIPGTGLFVWVQLAGWILCVVLFLGAVVAPVLRWITSTFTVTSRQVQIRSGVFMRSGSDVALSRITNVETERGILDRIFRCGTLIIKDAGSPDGMILRDIPNVQHVRHIISDLSYEASSANDFRGTDTHRDP